MAFTPFSEDMDIISKLADNPNSDDGMTPTQLKAEFDKAGKKIKTYINDTLLLEAVEKPAAEGLMKFADGTVSAAEAGKDYQAPMGDKSVSKSMLGDDVTAAALGGAVPSSAKTAALTVAGWTDKAQTVSVDGVTANGNIIVTPAPRSYVKWGECMVRATEQGNGTITFACEDVPDAELTANILIVG